MKNKFLLLISTVALFAIFADCKKSNKPDLSKYDEVCARVVQCDASISVLPDPQNNCKKLMGGFEEKLPQIMPEFQKCLTTTPCEELQFQACMNKHMDQIQGLMP
ncbi:MAG: hypothetical protein OEZ34_02240 [Spirochaetia bacterium]|nr:hypothetical protein [Spirochaetia bacterium]